MGELRALRGIGVFLCVLIVWIIPAASALGASDTYWQHDPNTAGDWFEANNWDAGVPTSADTAYVQNAGTSQIVAGSAETNRLRIGYQLGSSGAAELSGSGQLTTSDVWVGGNGTGRFTQTGGTHTVMGRLYVEASPSPPSGGYELSGASQLTVGTEVVWGQFAQTGGTHTVQQWADIYGTYELSGSGYLSVDRESLIGSVGTTHFTQSGGTHIAGHYLTVGIDDRYQAVYEMSGNGYFQGNTYVGYYGGTGTFIQKGDSNAYGFNLYLGYANGHGTYELSENAQRRSGTQYVGYGGTGQFTQTGGNNRVDNVTLLGFQSGSHGTYELSSGELSSVLQFVGREGTGVFNQTGGTSFALNNLILGAEVGSQGTYTISDGKLRVGTFRVGNSGGGTLNITGAGADITVLNLLHFGPQSALTAVPGATIHMSGSTFANENTDSNALAGLANLKMVFDGGTGDLDPFEVAGKDLKATAKGFQNNFTLGTVQLGGDGNDALIGQVQLGDDYDNSQDGNDNEVVYMLDLEIRLGSLFDLNGRRAYTRDSVTLDGNTYLATGGYRHFLPADFAGLTDSNTGGLVILGLLGDMDSSGAVNGDDINPFVLALTDPNAYLAAYGVDPNLVGDIDGSGKLDADDIGAFVGLVTGSQPVPEPGAIALLAIGGLALLRRRLGG